MASEKKMITLRSSDGEIFEVEEVAAVASQTIKNMIEDGYASSVIPLPNVAAKTLSKVIEYCKKHTLGSGSKYELQEWDREFIDLDVGTDLYDLVIAANYLNIKGLFELGCQTVADTITGWAPEKIRETFGIENDFTEEEEAAIHRENKWAFP